MINKNVINKLYEIIESRRENPMEESYTGYLFEKGLDKVLKKVGEECSEVIIASKNNNKTEMISELSDLTYHLLVLMAMQGIKLKEVEEELNIRREKIGNRKPERIGGKGRV